LRNGAGFDRRLPSRAGSDAAETDRRAAGLSDTETEQPIPLAIMSRTARRQVRERAPALDGQARCRPKRRRHGVQPGPAADNPAEPIFLAQLWNASLASA